jgi:hypothetical protein
MWVLCLLSSSACVLDRTGASSDGGGITMRDVPVVPTDAGPCPSGTADLDMDPENGCECVVGIEACDGDDDDCDTRIDEGLTRECGMMIGACMRGTETCEAGAWMACNATLPGEETCDGVLDENCDGVIDEGCSCTSGAMRDCGIDTGACVAGRQRCMSGTWSAECMDGVAPIDESCNAVDDDCDGATDEGVLSTFYADADGDTYGDPLTTELACMPSTDFVDNMNDCNDACTACYTGASESCDALDNDCDGFTDEGVSTVYYRDFDEDGIGGAMTMNACSLPAGYSTATGDCDDSDRMILPGATERCDGVDDDCDGTIDEAASPACPCPQAFDAGHSYLFCEISSVWTNAASRCMLGYDLARIESDAEQTFVWSQIDAINADWWIGLRRAATATAFSWEDGSALGGFHPWAPGEPVTMTGDVAVVLDDGEGGAWVVERQSRTRFYVCEAGP